MKPAIIIEFADGKRHIFISKVGLFIIGATVFVAVHIFVHSAIASYAYITKQVTKKKHPAPDLKLPRGGADSDSNFELVSNVLDTKLIKCLEKPGVYLILNERLKIYLRKQLQTFSTNVNVPVIIEPLAFLVANYMSKRLRSYLTEAVTYGPKVVIENLIGPASTAVILFSGAFLAGSGVVHLLALMPQFAALKAKTKITSFIVGGLLSILFRGSMINCEDHFKYYPIAAPNEQVVIDVKHAVILPEIQPNMMFVQTEKNLELLLPEYSEETCEVEIPKNVGLETVEPRGLKKGDGYYFKERCSRSRNLKAFSGKIHTLYDFQEVNIQDKKQAESDLETYSYKYKTRKERTKIRISNEEQNLFIHESYDE